MRTFFGMAAGPLLCLSLLAACSKPAEKTVDATAANANAAASDVAAPGGVVSAPPSPQNDAVNADTNKMESMQSAGSNSFTEAQAQGHIENAGYTDVSSLTKTHDGMWTGKAKMNGKMMDVSLDFKGAVQAK